MNEASEDAKKQVQQALPLCAEKCGVTILCLFFLHYACWWRTLEDTLQSMSATYRRREITRPFTACCVLDIRSPL